MGARSHLVVLPHLGHPHPRPFPCGATGVRVSCGMPLGGGHLGMALCMGGYVRVSVLPSFPRASGTLLCVLCVRRIYCGEMCVGAGYWRG